MSRAWRPAVSEERRITLVPRAGEWESSGAISHEENANVRDWAARERKTLPLLARALAFVAGLAFAGAVAAVLNLLHVPFDRWIAALVSLAVAELLINRFARFRSGIEEALFIAGAITMITALPGRGSKDVLLLLAAAFVLAAFRLLNSLFAIVAVGLLTIWYYLWTDDMTTTAYLVAGVGLLASLMQLRTLRRPWMDGVLVWLVIGSPMLSWALFAFARGGGRLSMLELSLLALLSIWLICAGIFPRLHPPIVGGLLLAAALAYDVMIDVPFAPEWRFLIAGFTALSVAVGLDRWFRTPRHGITSRRISRRDDLSLLEAAAVAISTPQAEVDREQGLEPGGGGFGGGGASGEY